MGERVYVLGTQGSNVVKIGWTTNLPRRLRDIQRMSPVPLDILWSHPGAGDWKPISIGIEAVRSAVERKPWVPKVSLKKRLQAAKASRSRTRTAKRIHRNMPSQGRTSLYRLHDNDGRLLYIGVATDPKKGCNLHRWATSKSWRHEIAGFTAEWFNTREDAERAQVAAIRSELPAHNRTHHPAYDDAPWSSYSVA